MERSSGPPGESGLGLVELRRLEGLALSVSGEHGHGGGKLGVRIG